ncbi:MAG: hypothetical protein LBT37_05650 [Lactobacillaceae bacterium]|jgi:hypothetical protein|nr:hypothetical protein [Lactobacillaceae bacterium]
MTTNKSTEKIPWYASLVIFSLVPLSQVVLYFTALPLLPVNKPLKELRGMLNMNNNQMITFQILSVLAFSIISFTMMYLVSSALLKLMAPNRNLEALFISLILAIGIGNGVALLVTVLSKTLMPEVPAMIQLIILSLSYYQITNWKDKRGTILLAVITLLMSVLPAFLY